MVDAKDPSERCIGLLGQRIRGARPDQCIGLLLGRLDPFNRITTTLGHGYAGKFATQFIDQLEGNLGQEFSVVSLSDRRFAVIAATPSIQQVIELADEIVDHNHAEIVVGGDSLAVDIIAGIAAYPFHGEDPAELLRRAELALESAREKELGYDLYRADTTRQVQALWKLESELEAAIENSEMEVYFQPQVEIESGRLIGIEALVRWPNSTGFVPPETFVPVAETTGMIVPLTWQVFSKVAEAVKEWPAFSETVTMAVNVTPSVMQDKGFYRRVMSLRDELATQRVSLSLEVTEDRLVQEGRDTLQVLKQLRESKIGLGLDDFGKGYSSLTHLKRIPASEIKIDRQFIAQLDTDKADQQIVQSLIDLAHGLGMTVIAEGVDRLELVNTLAELKCDHVQGFYLSRALPPEQLRVWIRQFRNHPPPPWAEKPAAAVG